MTIKHAISSAVVILFFYVTSTWATTLSVKLEPTQVAPGQPFHLILELDENAPSGLPDFSPLQYDFEISGTAHRTSYMFIDGQSKASSSWTVTLIPKRTGKLTIPAIQVGHARSTPNSIDVTNTPQAPSNTANTANTSNTATAPASALFLKTTTSESKPFINQQLIYTVKIYHNASILDASYQPPKLNDALALPLGTNRQYQVIENGRPYLVEEQKYAFFPQQSGTHILFPPSFQALIYDDIPRRVRAEGKSTRLDVKPIPEAFKNTPWTPAKSLALTEQYDDPRTDLSEGTTLTRVLTLRAAGLPAELLPPINILKSTAFNTYPEHPVLQTETQGDDVSGKKTIKISYLLNHAGRVTLPEQSVTWFNTLTGKTEHATLPERILNITAHASAPQSTTQLSPPNTTPEPNPDLKPKTEPTAHTPPKLNIRHAVALRLGFLTLLLMACIVVFFIRLNQKHKHLLKHQAFKTLGKACLNNQPQAARDALFVWAKLTWPKDSILNLDDIAQLASNTKLSLQLKQLSNALYNAAQDMSWHGKALLEALQQLNKKHVHLHRSFSSQKTDLPPINPEQ